MTCEQLPGGGIACNFTDKWTYVCFEHTTYIMEFSSQFGPFFYRLECGKEIAIEIEFDDDNEPTSNKFLWDIFDEWHYQPEIVTASFMKSMGDALQGKPVDNEFMKANQKEPECTDDCATCEFEAACLVVRNQPGSLNPHKE